MTLGQASRLDLVALAPRTHEAGRLRTAHRCGKQEDVNMDEADAGDVRRIVDGHNATLARKYAEGDYDAIASRFTEDAWQMPPNAPPLVGREAIRAFWSQAVRWGRWEFTLTAEHVETSGPLAIERGRYTLRFTAGAGAPSGMRSNEDSGHYLVHWRREADGEWRIAHDAPESERAAG
jgi:uncharacterized protein (TIGR02246 family)